MLVPSKLFTATSSGALRRLLGESVEVRALIDWSQSPRRLFCAKTYPAALVAQRAQPHDERRAQASRAERSAVRVEHIAADGRRVQFRVDAQLLHVDAGDHASPWALTPPAHRHAIERMRAAGPPLG